MYHSVIFISFSFAFYISFKWFLDTNIEIWIEEYKENSQYYKI